MTRFSTVLLLAIGATHALKETPELKKKKELRKRRLQGAPVPRSTTCTPCCSDKDGECEVSGCDTFETCLPCSYSGQDNAPPSIEICLAPPCDEGETPSCDGEGCVPSERIGDGLCDFSEGNDLKCYDNDGGDCPDKRMLTAGMPSFEEYRKSHKGPEMRRHLRFGSGGPSVVPADGCCASNLDLGGGCFIGPFNGYPEGENTGEYCAPGCVASCDGKACVPAWYIGDKFCDDDEGSDTTCYANDGGDCVSDKTTYTGEGKCSSGLNVPLDSSIIDTPEFCFEICLAIYNVDLVAIDWYPNGDCYCQDDCACMLDVGGDATTITRDSAVDVLPSAC